MAQKKTTQAQKASAAKNAAKSKSASDMKKSNKAVVLAEKEKPLIPIRALGAVAYLLLFILFLVIAMGQDGFMLTGLKAVIQGLFGIVAFYIAIPCMLYLFIIQAFSGKQPALLRSCCTLAFIFLCGCISHLSLAPTDLGDGFLSFIGKLFSGGAAGTTGGLICGLVTELLVSAFGRVFSYVVLIIGAVLCLLAACKFTIPSMIRAIQNRPRLEDEEDYEEPPEPAAIVVNHIANKHIDHVKHKRQLQQERAALAAAEAERQALEAKLAQEEQARLEASRQSRTADIMSQIDADSDLDNAGEVVADLPMTGSEEVAAEPAPTRRLRRKLSAPKEEVKEAEVVIPPAAKLIVTAEPVPKQMPPLELNVPEDIEVPVIAEDPSQKKVTAKDAAQSAQEVAAEIAINQAEEKPVYCFPPIDLLERPDRGGSDGAAEMRDNTRRLNETLASFKIEAHISNVTRGPSVTRYEVELEKGVRLNKLTGVADDIALSLGASGVRIAPIPGMISVVGIEVPNQDVTKVSLREVIDSQEFIKAKSKSSFAVGKDIGGSAIVGNIAKFPHLLIAGTTGSGKSVCMNSIIISLLYKASPEDVKLIMVDPKMVELGIYNGIPHLLIPVVTDPKKAAGSLQWGVTEMMRRYRSMSDAGVRDLESYNSMVDNGEIEGEHLPVVVVIIDELADLMLVAAKEVEESICRIAQMGRAAGIHLIIATQRPSADVITGLMKANIPSRIAFSVASAMESRIILDTQGAEKLVGKGDMLYAPIGCGKPMRVQGCFVTDSEVEAVAQYVKSNYTSNYDQAVLADIEKKAEQTGSGKSGGAVTAADPEPNSAELDGDEMLPAAVDVILETKQASVSMLQRRLKLGYARAARIVDEMEEKGIVGPFVGSKPRQILITKEQWELMKNGQTIIEEPVPEEPADEPVPEEIL